MLRSPWNGSIITTTEIELSWWLVEFNLLNVSYDVYFDTIFPPDRIYKSNVENKSIKIDSLVNGVTYYWKVIPRIGLINGSCESGVWSFAIEIPIPKVNLISPENGSIVSSPKPTLIWSVEYNGTETLKYDIYLDTKKDPGIEVKNYTSKYYLPKKLLEDGKIYYWKLIPKTGLVVGPESETWSFTVRKNYIPHFELELKVEPLGIVIEPASIKMVKAFVTNKGELTDRISLS
ncbi:MAG: hypothetical protein KAJ51_05225, partial [Thermoplasmata archaeon]|nr:hypothetical protein [Thermoplasmata archaeon]